MIDQNAYGAAGHVQPPYGGADTTAAPHRFIDQASSVSGGDEHGVEPQAGFGLYTLREWIVIFLGVALTVLSFFSAFTLDVISGYTPVWAIGVTWLGAAFFPLVAVLLIALRRFVPRLQNLGALSLDQLASVAFAVAAFLWLNMALIVLQISAAIDDLYQQLGAASDAVGGMYDLAQSPLRVGTIVWIALVVALAGVFFTVFARFVPPFSADFIGREQKPAHSTARPPRPLAKRARPAAPAAPAWPPTAPAAHGAPQPAYDPSGMTPPPAPAADNAVPPAPQPDGAAFGQPAPYDQVAPTSFDQETAPPYAQNAPDPHAQESAPPYTQGTPVPHAQDVPASDGQSVPSTYAAPAPTDESPAAEVADAPLPVDATPVDDVAVPESAPAPAADAQPDEIPAAADAGVPDRAPAVDAVTDPDAAPTDAVTPAEAATERSAGPAVTFGAQPMASTPAEESAAPIADAGAPAAAAADHAPAADASPIAAAPGADAAPQAAATSQPFWALAPVERDVHDFDGNPIYRVGPTAWALVLEDRGSYFVMRHDDGRIGYLHDTSGITRG